MKNDEWTPGGLVRPVLRAAGGGGGMKWGRGGEGNEKKGKKGDRGGEKMQLGCKLLPLRALRGTFPCLSTDRTAHKLEQGGGSLVDEIRERFLTRCEIWIVGIRDKMMDSSMIGCDLGIHRAISLYIYIYMDIGL